MNKNAFESIQRTHRSDESGNNLENKEKLNELKKIIALFNELPKYKGHYTPFAHEVNFNDDPDLAKDGVVLVVEFYPSLELFEENCPLEVHLKSDGSAIFDLVSFSDNYERFPELYSFKGNWNDSYLKVVELLKTGWPSINY